MRHTYLEVTYGEKLFDHLEAQETCTLKCVGREYNVHLMLWCELGSEKKSPPS